MKVLIVEDQPPKARELTAAVERAGLRHDDVVVVPDSAGARDRLRSAQFDIMLLDLQIPNRFGDGPNASGGAELVRWLVRQPSAKTPTHIIAVTSYALEAAVQTALFRAGIPVVQYSPSAEDWKEYIAGLLGRAAQARLSPWAENDRVDAVVITAVDVEHQQLRRVLSIQGGGEIRLGVTWHRGSIGPTSSPRTVVVAQASQMGMPAAAVLAAKAMRLWSPSIALMCGVCAGVKGESEIGDLIIPDPCWDYGSGKMIDDGVLHPDPRPVELRESIRALVRRGAEVAPLRAWREAWPAAAPRADPQVHLKPAASGAAVLADQHTVQGVRKHSRKLVGIDMENYGFYYACSHSGSTREPQFCSVKCVVDFADPSKGDDYQAYGAMLSARFAAWLIENAALV